MSYSPRRLLAKPLAGATINWSHQMAYGLVGAWLFNEGSGRVANNLCEQAGNLTAVTPLWGSGCGRFNQVNGNGFVSPSHRSSLSLTRVTVMCRCLPQGSVTPRGLMEKSTGTAKWTQYTLYLDSTTNDVVWTVKPSGSQVFCVGPGDYGNPAVDRHWHSFAGTADGVNIRVYTDGLLRDTDACGPPTTGAGVFTIGALAGASESALTGLMDVCYVWNRPLTSPDLEWLDEEPYLPIEAPIWRKYFIPAVVGGRTTFNTDPFHLGIKLGITRGVTRIAS